MTLQLKKSGSYTYLYAIKSFRKEDGRCTTKVVEKFGTVEELREKLGGEDPIEWARARVAEMTASEKEENQKVVVEYDPQTYRRMNSAATSAATCSCRRYTMSWGWTISARR